MWCFYCFRYKPVIMPVYPKCGHPGKPYQPFQCCSLTIRDIRTAHLKFYDCQNKIEQDCFILKHLETYAPKRKKYEALHKPRTVSTKYFIFSENRKKVPVCRSTFLAIFGIGKDRVAIIAKKFQNSGVIPKENLGGDHTSMIISKQNVSATIY